MCHAITRTLCERCKTQIGDWEVKELPCFPPAFRPAWGSPVSQFEQHRAKRYRKTKGHCNACDAKHSSVGAGDGSHTIGGVVTVATTPVTKQSAGREHKQKAGEVTNPTS